MQSHIAGKGGWSNVTQYTAASAAWKTRPPENTNTYIEFRQLAVDTIRMSRNAQAMNVNPTMLPTLGRDPTIQRGEPMHRYRTVVRILDATGRIVQDTAVSVNSSREIDAREVGRRAIQIAQTGQGVDPKYPEFKMAPLRPTWTFETEIVGAGRRI
jgi:hypothetical protein